VQIGGGEVGMGLDSEQPHRSAAPIAGGAIGHFRSRQNSQPHVFDSTLGSFIVNEYFGRSPLT
jgi:hypothetical protein